MLVGRLAVCFGGENMHMMLAMAMASRFEEKSEVWRPFERFELCLSSISIGAFVHLTAIGIGVTLCCSKSRAGRQLKTTTP